MSLRVGPCQTLWLAAALAVALPLQATPLLAQGSAPASPSCLPIRPADASRQCRSRAIVNGHHVQPRRRDVCLLLHRVADCRDGKVDAIDEELLREIFRDSAQ